VFFLFVVSFLGRAFEMAAEKTKARSQHDYFDPAGKGNDLKLE
jgi:hypothetical protein